MDSDLGDNGQITFSIISGNAASAWGIDASSGVIFPQSTLDRETTDSYDLVVEAADGAASPMTSTVTVTITITDVNDNSPLCSASPWVFTVAENVGTGTLATISCTDADLSTNAQLSYAIYSGASGKFTLGSTGVLSIVAVLDYETTTEYNIIIHVADQGTPSLTTAAYITVLVSPVNEHTPVITTPSGGYVGSVSEGVSTPSSTIVTVSGTDGDSPSTPHGVIRWSITDGNSDNEFSIGETTGDIIAVGPLDRETTSTYHLEIMATDSTAALGSQRSSSATVTITITDVNDNYPIFSPSVYAVAVAENAALSSTILQMTATDADSASNAALTYSITQGNSEGKFDISGDEIILNDALDAETTDQYVLQVVAIDGGTTQLSTTVEVVITVMYINEFDPVLDTSVTSLNVDEDTAIGTVIYTASATDNDAGLDGQIRSVENKNCYLPLYIDPSSDSYKLLVRL